MVRLVPAAVVARERIKIERKLKESRRSNNDGVINAQGSGGLEEGSQKFSRRGVVFSNPWRFRFFRFLGEVSKPQPGGNGGD